MAGGLGAVAMLSGCGVGTLTRAAPGPNVTLSNDNPTWTPGFTSAGKVLQTDVGHGLSPRSVPSVSSYQQVVRMSATTSSTTDMVKWWNGYRLQDVARGGIFVDLSDAWDRAEQEGWVDHSQRESFSYNGVPYAVPLYRSYYAMFYSKPAFNKIGAKPPKTWDELISTSEALRDAGIVPISSGGSSTWEALIWFQQLLIGLDPDFYTKLCAGHASYTDDTAQHAMELWVDMYSRKLFSPPDFQVVEAPGRFAKAQTAMNLYGTWTANTYVQAGFGDETFGLFVVPPVERSVKPAVVTESGALAVAKKAHKREDALKVAGAWLGTDVQQVWVNFLNDLSANPKAMPPVKPVQEVAADVKKLAPTFVTRYWEASPPVIVEGNVSDIGAFMAKPTLATARSTLKKMQNRAETEWKKWSL